MEPLFELTAGARMPTRHGDFLMETFRYGRDPAVHVVLSTGLDRDRVPLVRVHSECITSEIFGSMRCDCAHQLDDALRRIREAGSGLVVYLRQEGRGIGIENKLHAYALQDQGLDTVDANVALGLPIDARGYQAAVACLRHRNIRRCVLMTNNPDKIRALEAGGIGVSRAPLRSARSTTCQPYLETKRLRLGQDC